jgi:regulatory protein
VTPGVDLLFMRTSPPHALASSEFVSAIYTKTHLTMLHLSERISPLPTFLALSLSNEKCYSISMRITALEQQTNNPARTNLHVDGKFLMGISAELMLQLGLHLDQELSLAEIEQFKNAEVRQQAIESALNYLSFRPRSQEEVRRHLRKKETPSEIIEDVLAHLQNLDYINDKTFASFWVENREQFNPRGSRALRNELRLKGVEREIVEEIVDDEQDEELALRAGRKKALLLLQSPGMDYTKFRNRMGGFLQRRGFSYEAVSHTVRALWDELKTETPDE